jgi:hypothetical protein
MEISAHEQLDREFPVEEEVRHWGTDDVRAKGGDYFQAKSAPRRR